MPTILRAGPYRVYFFSHDLAEPRHVHVDRDDATAKYWLEPVTLDRNIGFRIAELRRIDRLLRMNETALVESWNDYFGD